MSNFEPGDVIVRNKRQVHVVFPAPVELVPEDYLDYPEDDFVYETLPNVEPKFFNPTTMLSELEHTGITVPVLQEAWFLVTTDGRVIGEYTGNSFSTRRHAERYQDEEPGSIVATIRNGEFVTPVLHNGREHWVRLPSEPLL